MRVKRIVANIHAVTPGAGTAFYRDILGLHIEMDHGWIQTYASPAKMQVQVSVASEGGSGTPVPVLSIEVDDLEEVLARVRSARLAIAYGPAEEPWGVRRFYVHDPFGNLVNILQHVKAHDPGGK